MPRFAGERRFYPWMTVIAQRLCIDHHRKAARVEPIAEIDGGIVEPDHSHLFAQVERTHLGAAMTRLAPRHREILELREGKGWSYQQIAQHLDVPMTTVEALLHRARKALRREYLAVGGDERLAPILPVVAGAGLLARIRTWLQLGGAERLAPALAAASAGVAAVGLVAGPLTPPPAPDRVLVQQPAAATPSPTAPAGSAPTSTPDETSTIVVVVPDTAGVDVGPSPTSAPTTVAPDVQVAGYTGYFTPEGADQVQEEGEQMPVNGQVGAVGYGVDPADIIEDTTALVQSLLGGGK
jgi:hypothetical protein